MHSKSGSLLLRWLVGCGLALAAVPIVLAWRASVAQNEQAVQPQDWPLVNGQPWVNPNEIEVQFKDGAGTDGLAGLATKFGLTAEWNSPQSAEETGIATFPVPAGQNANTVIEKLRTDSDIETADVVHYYRAPETFRSHADGAGGDVDGRSQLEERSTNNGERPGAITLQEDDGLVQDIHPAAPADTPAPDAGRWKPNDPRYGEQWNFRMVKAEEAWEVTRGKGIVVAVIDTGVASEDSKKGSRARDFGDTRFVKGYDFTARDAVPYDDNGHGTHVAGTIAESTDNNEGVTGLAFDAAIMPLKVLTGEGYGKSADIAEAVRWAADHGANVINMSLGGPFPDKLMRAACEYAKKKGVAIVCAAEKSGREGVGYPAAYPDCIAVSAVGPTRELSFYSTWGKQIAVAAPGGDKMKDPEHGGILQNTVLRDENGTLTDDYFAFQGTSMASPHVAAVAALIEAQGVKDPDDVRAVLQKSAQKAGPRDKYGAGIVDAGAAVRLAGEVHGDGVARFWIVIGLFTGCWAIGRLRQKAGSGLGYPVAGTVALAFGLLFPDWLTGYLGQSSIANLVGHSVLIPGALLVMGADGKLERRMLGWMALGLTLHLGWEFLRGTAPLDPIVGTWQLLPWVAANVIVGFGLLMSGLTASRDR